MVETRASKRRAAEAAGKEPVAPRKESTKRRKKVDHDDLFVVLVGEEQTRYEVHKNVLTQRSQFFRAACDPNKFKEGQEKVIHIPEQDGKLFEIYLQWAYQGKIVLPELDEAMDGAERAREERRRQDADASQQIAADANPDAEPETEDSDGNEVDEVADDEENNHNEVLVALTVIDDALADLIRLFPMAEYLGDTACMNAVVDRFIATYGAADYIPFSLNIELVYEQTSRQCGLREALVDAYVFAACTEWPSGVLTHLEECEERLELPRDFWVDLALANGRALRTPAVNPFYAERCYYHEHDADVPECSPLVSPTTAAQIAQAQADSNLL